MTTDYGFAADHSDNQIHLAIASFTEGAETVHRGMQTLSMTYQEASELSRALDAALTDFIMAKVGEPTAPSVVTKEERNGD